MADENKHQGAIEQLAAGAGLALHEWGRVEMMLTFLFVSVMDKSEVPHPLKGQPMHREPADRRIAHALFNSVLGFDARLDLLNAAIVEGDLSPKLLKLWPPIELRLRKKYKSRHEAAHFLIEVEEEEGIETAFLFPFATTVYEPGNKRLTRAHLDHKAAQFVELGEALYWYRVQIEWDRGRWPARQIKVPALIQRVRQSLEGQNPSKPEPPRPA